MNGKEYLKEKLWSILVETVRASVMYPSHKAYTRDTILREKPNITAMELAKRLSMSLGEALVILPELKEEIKSSA
jgi:hypothetical protein